MLPQNIRGWRYTIDDKVKTNKAVKHIRFYKMFALPLRKSILDLLQKIPFEAGINQEIVEHLKLAVQKIKNKCDRYCSVIFDEIALSASLQYHEKYGKVIYF